MSDSRNGDAYINSSERLFRLGQVSEAAAALAGTQLPDQLNADTATSKSRSGKFLSLMNRM